MEKENKKIDVETKNKKNSEKKDVKKSQTKSSSSTKASSKKTSSKTSIKEGKKSTNKKQIKNGIKQSDTINEKKTTSTKNANKTKEDKTKKTVVKTKETQKKNATQTKKNSNNELTSKKNIKIEKKDDENLNEIKISKDVKKEEQLETLNIASKKSSKNNFGVKEVVGIMIITAIVSFFVGNMIKPKNETTSLGNYEKELLSNYRDIVANYYKDIDARDLVKYATKGMIYSLNDPYATYIDIDAIDDFNIDIYGEYEGIGIQMSYNDEYEPIVVYVYPNSPAANGGLEEGDILVYIDDTGVIGKDLDAIKELITSYGDKEFKLIFQRDGEGHEAMLKKDKIIIESVATKLYERNGQKIGYLSLNNFAKNSDEQFNTKLKELEKENIDSLIIDLRYNSGGELESVHNIVSLFVPKGETIYQFKEKDKITKYYSDNDETRDYKVVILANGGSASASELMIGALKEVYGATIIGTKTFGKGTGQQVVTLENGEKYKFTTKEWLTAKGNSIDEVGIKPTIEVEQSEEYNDDPVEENDTQLNAALEFLTK